MQAQLVQAGESIDFTPIGACLAGDVVMLPDGRAGVCGSDIAAGELGAAYVVGIFKVLKTASIALLAGGDVYWDVSAGKAHFRPESGSSDYRAGTVAVDAIGADTTVLIVLNGVTHYVIDLEGSGSSAEFVTGSVAGTTATVTTFLPNIGQINILNTSEAQGAAIVSAHAVLLSAKPIFECRFTRIAASGSASDFDWGLASGSHASDFDALDVFAVFHNDGGDANIDTQSDDTGTDRAIADSTIDLVDSTYAEYWIDTRDDANVKFYVDAVLVDTASVKRVLTAALATAVKAVVEIEKTTGTETASARVSRLRVRLGRVE